MPYTFWELYNRLLNKNKTQYDKLTKGKKKRIKVQNIPEKLPIVLYLDKDVRFRFTINVRTRRKSPKKLLLQD